ncbi:hypothetical protein F5050DRAFT_644451 [Lentinula boryana]|uniref:Uncharacterized protein n=1 Tax=Lentinula boryana TaxID=40481 RepID=A0ABQ8Q5J2_9AGAR|nr:hypothetical protein F5050DRAFT_644451 [Lentinula boryana]
MINVARMYFMGFCVDLRLVYGVGFMWCKFSSKIINSSIKKVHDVQTLEYSHDSFISITSRTSFAYDFRLNCLDRLNTDELESSQMMYSSSRIKTYKRNNATLASFSHTFMLSTIFFSFSFSSFSKRTMGSCSRPGIPREPITSSLRFADTRSC